MRLIVTSSQDTAGANIYKLIASRKGFEKTGEFEGTPVYSKGNIQLIATEKGQVHAEHLDDHFNPEYYVFASRHRSTSEERTLTVHVTGNLTDEAKVGGMSRQIAKAEPDAMKTALLTLEKERKQRTLDYKVSLEATHHGPTSLKKPVLFVEVGSTEVEWNDAEALEAVAEAALVAAGNQKRFKKGVGIGGNHYAPRHTRFLLESNATLGHIIPSYSLDSVDDRMISDAALKSSAEFFFLDWKGMKKSQRDRIMRISEEMDIPVRRNISSTKNETQKGMILFKVHEEIFTLAQRMDREKLRHVIEENKGVPVESGGHLTHEFSAPRDIRLSVLKACIDILRHMNPRMTGENLTLEFERFDPEKAKRLGLEPGPDFAKLKNGGVITAGGREIHPEEVITKSVRKIKLDKETHTLLKSFI